eukprot:TRINITY_DN0_c1306_g1_i2.p2 TRINITY_DN0_c1306_g1~~TRINITY_DN0_c1306_g1_i2.p2  ORF type:complete len:111 (-),score=40.48 TRINITY_DN0_c1306_g1_i2:123-455(-)
MAQRVRYTRRHSYNTKSNRIRKVKTPGGRVVAQYMKKKTSPVICPITKQPLGGIPTVRPQVYRWLSKRERRVSRAYGGSLSAQAVRDRIIRAFLVEEVKIVKRVVAKGEQ